MCAFIIGVRTVCKRVFILCTGRKRTYEPTLTLVGQYMMNQVCRRDNSAFRYTKILSLTYVEKRRLEHNNRVSGCVHAAPADPRVKLRTYTTIIIRSLIPVPHESIGCRSYVQSCVPRGLFFNLQFESPKIVSYPTTMILCSSFSNSQMNSRACLCCLLEEQTSHEHKIDNSEDFCMKHTQQSKDVPT